MNQKNENEYIGSQVGIEKLTEEEYQYAFKLLKEEPEKLLILEDKFRNNKLLALQFIKNNVMNIQYFSENIQDNEDVFNQLIENNRMQTESLTFISNRLRNNKELMLKIIKKDGLAIQYASPQLQNNIEIVQIALEQQPHVLKVLPDEMKFNREMVLIALKKSSHAIKHVISHFAEDRELIEYALLMNGSAMKHFSTENKDDKELAKLAVVFSSNGIEHISERLRGDKEIGLLSVKGKKGSNFQYLSSELKNDKEVVSLARNSCIRVLGQMSNELKNDFKFALENLHFIKENKNKLLAEIEEQNYYDDDKRPNEIKLESYFYEEGMGEILKNNKTVMFALINLDIEAVKYISDDLKNDEEFAKMIVSRAGENLKYFSEEIQDNVVVVSTAILNNPNALEFASYRLKTDRRIIEMGLSCNSEKKPNKILQYMNPYMENNKELIEYALDISIDFINSIPSTVIEDRDFMLKMVTKHSKIFPYCSDTIKNDDNIVRAAVIADNKNCLFTSERIKNDIRFIVDFASICKNKTSIEKYIGSELKEQIGNTNIYEYLEKAKLSINLQDNLPINIHHKNKNKKKI